MEVEVEGVGRNTLSLIEETLNIRTRREKATGRKFDYTWAVFDRDSFPSDNFDGAISKGEACSPPVRCAWTNEAFELWFLLHFEYINNGLSRDGYKRRISNWVTQRKGSDFVYDKSVQDMYKILTEYGNEAQAIKWAKKLEAQYDDQRFSTHNPRTKVYQLVEALNKLKSS